MSIYQEIIINQDQFISQLRQKDGHTLNVELSSNVAHLSFGGSVEELSEVKKLGLINKAAQVRAASLFTIHHSQFIIS